MDKIGSIGVRLMRVDDNILEVVRRGLGAGEHWLMHFFRTNITRDQAQFSFRFVNNIPGARWKEMTTAKIGPDLWLGRIRSLLEREPSDVTIIWDTVLWTNFEPINESKNLFIYKDKKFTACLANAGSRIILRIKYKKREGVFWNITEAFLSQTFHSNRSSV